MQKWEYLFIVCGSHKGAWRPQYVNGQELRDWQNGSSAVEYSNKLGEEGWEMINLVTQGIGQFTYVYRLVFKRAK
jgi:hypothetical protein